MQKQNEYNKVIDALNVIDEQAEQMGGDIEEQDARALNYEIVSEFIDKYAIRKEKTCFDCGSDLDNHFPRCNSNE